MGYLRRQLVTAALTANAVRPLGGRYASIPAFFAGWLASELAPQLLAASALDTAAELTVRRRKAGHPDRAGLLLAGAATAGLGYLIVNATRSATHVETTLRDGLGDDYLDELEEPPGRRGPQDPAARDRPAVQADQARRRGHPRHQLHRGRQARPARHLPAQGRRPRERPGARAGPRRRLDDRHQGAAGPAADEPDGRARLGLRGDELPARPQAPVPRADRRRQEGDRLDAREHRLLRRRPVVPRRHRWLRRRPPRRAGRPHAGRRGVPARLRERRHQRRRLRAVLRRLRPRRASPATRRRSTCATTSSARACSRRTRARTSTTS